MCILCRNIEGHFIVRHLLVAASVTVVCGSIVFVINPALVTETRRAQNTVRPSVLLLRILCVICLDIQFLCV
jgi:hypothetical protein